jgi:hypothetical protein
LLDRYIGYLEPYATSHDALDADRDIAGEIDNAIDTLIERVDQLRAMPAAGAALHEPRAK